ncbi:50S ribosome-binding protein YggL [Rubritalea tangerina]|uniref:50S ribosome-binding protein YggL n=1 Tax=Rubritalea tangerina TaxID=430798 RepID=A0ABW4Z9W5_9BACT
MKKRLRKKKHLGEFAVFGYSLVIHTKNDSDEPFLDSLISKVEFLRLQFGDSMSGHTIRGVIESSHTNSQVTELQLASLKSFLTSSLEVNSVYFSEPWDIYYGHEPLIN